LWRYTELLPVDPPDPALSLNEGGTPLLRAKNLGSMLGLESLYIKDERQNPTSSFKDRQAAVTVAALRKFGLDEAVVSSTGNVAIAYSAFCARYGIKLWAFLTSLVPAVKMHEVSIYGTQLVKVTGTYDQAKKLAVSFAEQRGLYKDRGPKSVAGLESMKTIAFEIAEQLAKQMNAHPEERWPSPDWYVQAVSGGMGPLGVAIGFEQLQSAGLTADRPALAIIQTEGCSPMTQAWKADDNVATPVLDPRTHITTLTTGDPGRAYTLLREKMLAGPGGTMETVTDEEAYRAMISVAEMEGLSLEPAAAVAFAGLFKLARSGQIKSDQVVVVNCSGHTMPVEKSILGDKRTHDLRYESLTERGTPQEGLLAALANLDQEHFRRILIVDDQADARRLIRRVLDAHGDFSVEEAASAADALQKSREKLPNLIILDLMMPEMDGFALLDRFRTEGDLAEVPVIVVTAKELTKSENERLEGQISKLMTKGDFLGDDLIDEIDRALDQ
jgi:threonine synthase